MRRRWHFFMDKQALKLMTLNIRHGWKIGQKNPFRRNVFQGRTRIEKNLDEIAFLHRTEEADIVALQEADRCALWSGKFNHIAYLAAKAGYREAIQGEHVNRPKLAPKLSLNLLYGTALLSRLPMSDSRSVSFDPSPPMFRKGFVTGTIVWPGRPETEVDIVSLHLDCYRSRIRSRQADEIMDFFYPRRRPMVVMGDFNCEWHHKKSSLRRLCDRLDLKTYAPEMRIPTCPKIGRRVDWILVSPELEFLSYRILSEIKVSDHKPVVATIGLK
ncbi:hypothetical protein A2303_02125 [Candidatus Falkowbacteria bacterium RIFOXYB2_FULL_47_14]|uniref:Endonuclease/exonuclease/phosphatase domain-containing protein n=1 Tax=Candidatus Falkowbacteria bacterium RIFOXYA2_FULL_47_19 TaxID=1797994 RepID=A0A1F5SEK9_9BACT|nr:MAG: hypothetical protein A2227_07305 [Candidatus Falkowbacteria bacterium RIFOXYA2_FULL_47_19]OGF35224.1 MAG: hypothetical protein A2468_00930 [Candidatus Falkowbacteria bacterium RIFOXYC2_FULL_46_15]OGF43864.1 MAG: hypothetical protein A2303_02125 [Candidatus Falkowbacteria bacterium RIFOXYB2_FULL_47_14]